MTYVAKIISRSGQEFYFLSQSLNTIFQVAILAKGSEFLSDSVDDTEKKADESSQQSSSEATVPKEEQKSEPSTPAAVKRPIIGTPIGRPKIGTPIGTPTAAPVAPGSPQPAVSAPKTPTIGTPVGTSAPKPIIGTPVGSRPTIGTPVGSSPKPITSVSAPSAAPTATRPIVSSPSVARPTTPVKKPESKEDISRRNFMRGLVVLGGLVAVVQFGALGPFLQGSVAQTRITSQVIIDSLNGETVTASTFNDPTHLNWVTFVFPRTGNPNIDNDTFHQCVAIKLPKGFTAPAELSAKDSEGNVYVGFS